MIHLGDITKISGYTAPIVDIITGGSPCQDLSVAGKRAGLDGERSGLFMEQIRIIKEMRDRDVRDNGRTGQFIRPRFMVWENVKGAFSSPGKGHVGEDFQAVLTEIVKIVCPEAPDVPLPVGGRWDKSGCLYDELGRWSIAWRLFDAQFWGKTQYADGRMLVRGTPQRRERIALVADFGGLAAPEVLFERKGLSWDSEQSGAQGQGAADGTEERADTAICLQGNGIDRADTAGCNGRGWKRGGLTTSTQSTDTPCTLKIRSGCEGGGKGPLIQTDMSATLGTANDQTLFCDVYNQTTDSIAPSMTAAVGGANTSGPKVLCVDQGGANPKRT